MRIIYIIFLTLSPVCMHGNTTKELLLKTIALMDTLHTLKDEQTPWPQFKEHRHYVENTCVSLSSQKINQCIEQCRIIFNKFAYKITNFADLDAIQKTLELLENAVQSKQVVMRAESLPRIDLDAGIISTKGENECTINGSLLITGTTILHNNIAVTGVATLDTLSSSTATITTLTVTHDALFNSACILAGKNTLLNAVGSYPDAQLRIVAGIINTTNLATTGGGFTVIKNNRGSVTIRFNTPFVSIPVVTATAMNSVNAAYLASASPEEVTIQKINDGIIHFIAIGQ